MTLPMVDSSGNGHDGTHVNVTPGTTGLVAGDTATQYGSQFVCFGYSHIPPDAFNVGAGDFTINCWVAPPAGFTLTGAPHFGEVFDFVDSTVFPTNYSITMSLHQGAVGSNNYQVQIGYGGHDPQVNSVRLLPDDGSAHMLTFRFSAAGAGTLFLDIDGVLDNSRTPPNGGIINFTPPWTLSEISGRNIAGTTTAYNFGVVDEFSAHLANLGPQPQWVTDQTSFDAYTADVMAATPDVYYHLNGGGSAPGGPIPIHELFIPHKSNVHSANWRAVELWAEHLRQQLNP